MSRPRIVIGQPVFEQTLEALRPHAEVVAPIGREPLEPGELDDALAQADAWMAFMPDSIDEARLARAPRLRIVAGALKGGDNFDVAACTRRAVWFTIAPDLLTTPTAELAIGLIIGLGRNLLAGDRHVRSGDFHGWEPRFYGTGLHGARVGLVGMGAIGRAIAERLTAFAVEQRFYDPSPPSGGALAAGALTRVAELDDLLAWADYVVLGAPLSPETLHLIDGPRLARMRPGALLVNPSRGSLVEERAVLQALQSGRLGGYAADAFEMEDWARSDRPLAIAPELLQHPQTLFAPHLGSAVIAVRRDIERCAADNIIDALSGRTPRNAVNPQARSPGLV